MGANPYAHIGYGVIVQDEECHNLLEKNDCEDTHDLMEDILGKYNKEHPEVNLIFQKQASYESDDVFLILAKETHRSNDWDTNSERLDDLDIGAGAEHKDYFVALAKELSLDESSIGWHLFTYYG